MSDSEHALPQPASDIQARAAEFLVARSDRNHWSAADEAELDAWLAESLAHQTAFWRLEFDLGSCRPAKRLAPPCIAKHTCIAPAAPSFAVSRFGCCGGRRCRDRRFGQFADVEHAHGDLYNAGRRARNHHPRRRLQRRTQYRYLIARRHRRQAAHHGVDQRRGTVQHQT